MDVDSLIRVQGFMDNEFSGYLNIDEFKLDKEWATFPGKFMEVCEKMLQAQQDWNTVKNMLEREEAKYNVDIRDNPKNYTLSSKVTEAFIDGMVVLQPRIQKLKQELSEKQYLKDRYSCLVKAMESKKKSLESMVHLMGLQYYSEPKQRVSAQDVKQQQSSLTNKKIRDNLLSTMEEDNVE